MKNRILLTILILTATLCACSNSGNISDEVAAAELAIANEDVDATREICNGIMDTREKKQIEASQYARLSILYMQLNERTDNPDDVELAAQCYREAYRLNPDSAAAYYRSLPVDQDKYAMALASIVHTLDNPREIPIDHDVEVPADEVGMVDATVPNDSSPTND